MSNTFIELLTGTVVATIIVFYSNKRQHKFAYFKNENEINELVHDLKTPATAQLRVAEHLIKGTFGPLTDEQKEIIIQLNNSSRFMLDIINNVLTLCKIKHDNYIMKVESFDINDIIKQCLEDLKYIAVDKRCSFLFDYSHNTILVKATKIEITRVILNLLINAVNYSHADRVITITSKIINNEYQFSVNSFGDVILKEDMQCIFDKYKSLKKTGTGLGLYICEIIMKKHKSKMFVNSDSKNGNCFGFHLPICEQMPVHI